MSKANRRDVTQKYEPLAEHPDGLKPPFPCNRWCKKVRRTHDGELVEETIMPWLDECKDKQVPCGAVVIDGKVVPAFRPHLGFEEIDYIIVEESAFKYDENGVIVTEKDEETGREVPVSDFKYVSGIAAIAFMSEHVFRIASATVQTSQQSTHALQTLNNNMVQLCKMTAHIIKLNTPADQAKIEEVADQTGNAPRIVT